MARILRIRLTHYLNLGVGHAGHSAASVIASSVPRDSYAVYWVAEMVIVHLDASGGQWPMNWEDLRADYEKCASVAGGIPWSLEELSARACLDWSADTAELTKAAKQTAVPKIRVIWLADGYKVHWNGEEPNEMILDYLSGRRKPLAK